MSLRKTFFCRTPPLFRQTRAKPPSVDYGMFFLSLNPHDPTAHCSIPMEHTIVYKRVLQLYFPQTPGISSNSLIFLKFIAFRAISRSCRCLQYPDVSIIDSWDGGGCTVVLFVFCFSQMFAFYPVIFCET